MYYDPVIGTFLSPDTLVPDPTSVWDYNRCAYVRGNPLKYNDPTGHCISNKPAGEEPLPAAGDGMCWAYVDHILGLWEKDQTGYWEERYPSPEVFRNWVATAPTNNADFMFQQIINYQLSIPNQPIGSGPPPVGKSCAEDKACNQLMQAAKQVDEYCSTYDCVAQSLDVISTSTAGLAAACMAGIVTAPCSLPSGGISLVTGGLGTVWTGYQVLQGNGYEIDLATAATTFTLGMKGSPVVGFFAGLYQTYWDFERPSLQNNQ